ncbi:MAG: hypothetical protein JNL25_08150 [Rhodospirillaceae bacterium]|nr:hypothetical protein [Rhodospirillaceae bacterium]
MSNKIAKLKYAREVNCYHRAVAEESVADRHSEVLRRMEQVEPPLGWANAVVPPAPEFGKEIYAGYGVKYQDKRIKCNGGYAYRDAEYLSVDQSAHDDHLFFRFDIRDPEIDYGFILHVNAPQIIEAFGAYRADVGFFFYGVLYEERKKETPQSLRGNPASNFDGRNSILTLEAACFWDAELCRRALGYGRDEVIRRLDGKVPRVEPLIDGVYVVFNDDPDLTFEAYCAYNDALKPVLGLA